MMPLWTLPEVRHVPGSGTAPARACFQAAKTALPALVDQRNWQGASAYGYGFDLYNSCYFWEAHEVWEAVWLRCKPGGRERHLLAALIQLANARLKCVMSKPKAVERLLVASETHLAEAYAGMAPDDYLMGLQRDAMMSHLRALYPEHLKHPVTAEL